MTKDYILHHGIKGQKWYVRRYQNPDGSLTAAGRERIKSEFSKRLDSDIQQTIMKEMKEINTLILQMMIKSIIAIWRLMIY